MLENPSQNITKNRADLSQFLIHLTKNGSFRIYEPFRKNPGHYLFKGGDTLEAKDSLIKLLRQEVILARAPFGHFQYQIPVGYQSKGMMPLDWLQCVCFSEAPISELKAFYRATQNEATNVNRYQKYGLAFSQAFVRSRGGHPIFYFDSNNPLVVAAVNNVGDFNFKFADVSFGLCPEVEIDEMEKAVNNEFPFIDPDWEQEKIRGYFLRKGFGVLAEAI